MKKTENYILSCEQYADFKNDKKIAVLVHLYYEDTVDYYFKYINDIPEDIDVYISSSKENIRTLAASCIKRNYLFIKSCNRGRDIAALLVAAKKYIRDYDYICFAHDKKEKRIATKGMTKQWIQILWENVLYNSCYISNVIKTFEKNDKVGLLLPPILLSPLNDKFLFNCWGNNYNNTIELAEMLGVISQIKQSDPVMSLGTVFWMRRKAMKKLLDFDWNYEDFVDEPLPDDGTLSHAIERILPYVADDSGYSSACIMAEHNAPIYMEMMRSLIIDAFSVLEHDYKIENWFQLKQYNGECDELICYVKKYKKVYIYGTGNYGQACYRLLKYYGIKVNSFINSQVGDINNVFGVQINQLEQIKITDSDCVVIAVSKQYRTMISEKLKEYGYNNIAVYSKVLEYV